jgi:hypothetical protein
VCRGGVVAAPAATTVPAAATIVVASTPAMATATATAAIMFTRAWRRRGCGSKCCLGGNLRLICKHGLLDGEHGASLAEGGEQGGVSYVVGCGGELGVEAVDEVEDKLGPRDGVADIMKRVGEGFDVLTVVDN